MKKVITYGTYDLFNQGHYNLRKRAKELGDFLFVGEPLIISISPGVSLTYVIL